MALNKYLIGFIVLVIIVAVVIVFFGLGGTSLFSKTAKATFKDGKTVTLEVADTEKAREIGLSNHRSLADDRGMLFLFDQPGLPAFWMKGMSFPIDIVFLNKNKIVTIYKNVPAPKDKNDTSNLPLYQPTAPADKVIELKANASDTYNLKEGQTVDLSI